ncbi:MAG: hypothetical protein GY869_03720 [Planctomycetes bacterium]|nr:hypothetical protein [Planctomycetota bacterium]
MAGARCRPQDVAYDKAHGEYRAKIVVSVRFAREANAPYPAYMLKLVRMYTFTLTHTLDGHKEAVTSLCDNPLQFVSPLCLERQDPEGLAIE